MHTVHVLYNSLESRRASIAGDFLPLHYDKNVYIVLCFELVPKQGQRKAIGSP